MRHTYLSLPIFLLAASGLQGTTLGVASAWNAFVFDSIVYSNTSTDRGLAAGNSIQLTNMFISELVGPGNIAVEVLSGGSADLQNGSVNGSVQYATTGTNSATLPAASFVQAPSPFDFAMIKALFGQASTDLGNQNNSTSTFEFGTLTLTGTSNQTNYFVIDPLASAANNVILNIPDGATAVVTLTGTNVTYQFGGMNTGSTPATRILWNAPNATSVVVSGVPLSGSLLAPNALVNLSNGTLRGQLVADQLIGASVKLEYAKFNGNLGNLVVVPQAPVPEPSTFGLAAAGLAWVLFRARRRN